MTFTNAAVAQAESMCRRDGGECCRVEWTDRHGERVQTEPLSPYMARAMAREFKRNPGFFDVEVR